MISSRGIYSLGETNDDGIFSGGKTFLLQFRAVFDNMVYKVWYTMKQINPNH